MAALQELSATLRERQACHGIEDVLVDERRSLRRHLAEAHRGAAVLAEAASGGPTVPILAAGIERLERSFNDVAEQVKDVRKRLASEVQSLRRALSGIAEVVHAMKPVLDADSEQRADDQGQLVWRLESGIAGLREEVREYSGSFPHQEHRMESGIAGLREEVRDLSRLLPLEKQQMESGIVGLREEVREFSALLPLQEQRMQSGIAGLREEVREFSGLFPLREQRVELCDLVNTKAKSRLLSLERDSGDLRRHEQTLSSRLIHVESQTAEGSVLADRAMSEAREAALEAATAAADSANRLSSSLRDTEKKLAAEAQACSEKAVADSEDSIHAANKRVADLERTLQAGIGKLHTELRDALKAHSDDFGDRLAAGISGVEARCVEIGAGQRVELDRSLGEVDSATRAALSRAMRGLSSEIAAEKKHRLANEEDMVSRLSRNEQSVTSELNRLLRGEQSVASETHDQGLSLHSLKDCFSAHAEKQQREERAIWAKLHEVSKVVHEKLPSEQRSVLLTEVDVHSRGLRHELHQELSKRIDEQFQRAASGVSDRAQDVEEKAQRALSNLDVRTKDLTNLVEEQIRRALGSVDCRYERCVEQLLTAQQHHESTTAITNEKRLESVVREARSTLAESEARCGDLQRCSRQDLEDVRSELRDFMDEQRVFCGFLDTEQRSYQDLMRQEVSALSRLVDSILRASAAGDLRNGNVGEF